MLSLSKFINVPVFIISLLIGLSVVSFAMNGEIRTIQVFPTPDNANLIQYKDNANICFEYKQQEVTCPADEKQISNYVPQ